MRTHWFLVLLLVSIFGCTHRQSESPTKGTILMMTTESLAPLIRREADEFHRLYPEATVTVTPTSTRDAIVHMLNDSVRLIIVDRHLNTEEQEVVKRNTIDVAENRIAKDALALIVNKRNPIQNISLASLESILAKDMSDWKHVERSRKAGTIELAFTGRNSGAYELLMSHFFELKKPIVPDHLSETQHGVLEYVGSHPGALGIVSLAALDTAGQPDVQKLKESIHTLAVSGKDSTTTFVKLNQANVYRELYSLHYSIYLYTTSSSASVAAGFSAFIASVPGQKIFLNAGLIPATMPVRLVQTTQEPLSQ